MLLQEAVEFIDRLNEFKTEAEVNAALLSVLGLWDIEHFAFASIPQPHQTVVEVELTRNIPQAWFDHYRENNFVQIDAAIRHAKHTIDPFRYLEAPDPENKAERLIAGLRDAGLAEGLMVPVSGPIGTKGIAWLQGKHISGTAPAFLHTIVLYAYERLARLHNNNAPPALTQRECEVLTWAALGKSAWETGEILKIGQRTVEEHIYTAMRKLGAANRVHAVALGLRDRLITI